MPATNAHLTFKINMKLVVKFQYVAKWLGPSYWVNLMTSKMLDWKNPNQSHEGYILIKIKCDAIGSVLGCSNTSE